MRNLHVRNRLTISDNNQELRFLTNEEWESLKNAVRMYLEEGGELPQEGPLTQLSVPRLFVIDNDYFQELEQTMMAKK